MWSIEHGKVLTNEEFARRADVNKRTINRLMNGRTKMSWGTFEAIGHVLNRSPETLVQPLRIDPIPPGSQIHYAFAILVDQLNDEKIGLEDGECFIQHVHSASFQPTNVITLSGVEWNLLGQHLVRRGHLYQRYSGTFGIATFTKEGFLEVLDLRENFECQLVERYFVRPKEEQVAIRSAIEMSIDFCKQLNDEPLRYVEAEVQIHLAWCYDNHTIRDAFSLLLKRSKQVADRILQNSQNGDYRKNKPDSPEDWDEILRCISPKTLDRNEALRLVRAHVNKVREMVQKLN